MKIRVQVVNKNEEELMPFFIKHYSFADEIVIVDGFSTDNSIKIAKELGGDKVKVVRLDDGRVADDSQLLHIRNNAWKEGKENFDWQIVVDMDEFLYHPDLINFLKNTDCTIPLVHGFDMISKEFPDPSLPLFDQVSRGVRDKIVLDKSIIFNPNKVDINYEIGCHTAKPTGEVIYSKEPLFMLHFKWLGLEYLIRKSTYIKNRLSDLNKKKGWGYHYAEWLKNPEERFHRLFTDAKELIHDRTHLKMLDDFVYKEIFDWNVYNMDSMNIMNKNVLDIGGQYGMFTIQANDLGAGKIITVEANPVNFEHLKKNTNYIKNLELINAAVSSSTTPVSISIEGGHSEVGKPGTTVNTVSLSHLTSLFEGDIVLKMDIEGSEYDVLYTAPKDVIRRFNIMAIEMHEFKEGQSIKDLYNYIISLGYEEVALKTYFKLDSGGNKIPINDFLVYKFVRR